MPPFGPEFGPTPFVPMDPNLPMIPGMDMGAMPGMDLSGGMMMPGMMPGMPMMPGMDMSGMMMPGMMPGMPQPLWPGLQPTPSEIPGSPASFNRPNPRIPGTLEQSNLQRMGVELTHAISNGEINDAAFREWSVRPWMAYPFLAQRMPQSPALAALEQWYAVASQAGDPRQGDLLAQQWAAMNPQMAEVARQQVLSLSRGLNDTLNVRNRTGEHLRALRENTGVNFLETGLQNGRRFILDDFRNHPGTSIALVVSAVLIYKMLKGTRAGKFLAYGAAATVIGTFVADRYGVRLGEVAARVAETVGGQRARDAVVNIRDTIRRPFMGPEGEGSAIGYWQEQLGIVGEEDRLVFQSMLDQNPREFLEWYSQARGWQSSNNPNSMRLPPSMQRALSNARMPTWFRQLSNGRKVDAVLRVADRMFQHIGRNTPGMDPVAYLLSRYVEGTHFQDEYGQWQAAVMASQPGSELYPFRNLDPAAMRDVHTGLQQRTQTGARAMDFRDILIMEMGQSDWHNLRNYNGAGWSASEVAQGIQTGAQNTWEFARDNFGRPVVNLFTTHIPNLWNERINPFLARNGITIENFQTQFMTAYRSAVAAGREVITFAEGTVAWRVLRDAGLLTYDNATRAWTITIEQAERFAVYLEWQRIEARANAAGFGAWRNDVLDAGGNLNGTVTGGSIAFVHTADIGNREQIWTLLRTAGAITQPPTIERNVPAAGNLRVTITTTEAERLRAWLTTVNSMLTPAPAIDAADRDYVTNMLQPACMAVVPPLTLEIRAGPQVRFHDPARAEPGNTHIATTPLATIRAAGPDDATRAAQMLARYNVWIALPVPTRRLQPNPFI